MPKALAGHINLPILFETAAQRLLLAVEQGRLLHKTKNIRDAGAPFEAEFRRFLQGRLPMPFAVKQGYLFSPKSLCTPQIDAMVIDQTESHEVMTSDDGAAYVPFPSGRTIFEIKNSSRGLLQHVGQISAVGSAIDAMQKDAQQLRVGPGGAYSDRALTVLVIGDSRGAKISSFKKIYAGQTRDPGFTLLLDKGLIIGRQSPMDQFFAQSSNDEPTDTLLSFYSYKDGASWGIWEPKESLHKRGRALLWLYFAVVAQLNLSTRGNTGSIIDFTNQIARDFPMVLRSPLHTATAW